MTTHTAAPADDLGNCPECGLPARECTALTMARLSASEYLEDNAGLSRHAAKARALELIPERAKTRSADDLVRRLEAARPYQGRSAQAFMCHEAAARIRSLEEQRDEAVGHLRAMAHVAPRAAEVNEAYAFLDRMKEEG